MIVILTGAPGAGKGTQAEMLAERCGWRKISTGDALRKHIKLATEVGRLAASYMNEGRLVPDDVLFGVLKEELGEDSNELVLLDGYPRTLEQAKTLSSMANTHPVKAVLHLDVAREELVARLSGRRTCSQCGGSYHVRFSPPKVKDVCDRCGGALLRRPDDEPAKIAVRLDVYDKETSPVIDYYSKQGAYHRLDGADAVETVFAKLKAIVSEVVE